MKFILKPGELTLEDLQILANSSVQLELSAQAYERISASEKLIADVIQSGKIIYGINTGFGALATTHIPESDLENLQRCIVLSHAAGVGELLDDRVVRLMLALKINSLARGFSGVRRQTIDALIALYNAEIYPCIPSQGSVGASGDLAPLAHLSTILLGVGEARYQGKIISATEALAKIGLSPLIFAPKEGLALLNGTQASTALALTALFSAYNIFSTALVTGAMSVDAARGSDQPFDNRIQEVRGHPTQIMVAQILRKFLEGSQIRQSHLTCNRVQDPYSLRCQPQVMGACLSQLYFVSNTLVTEANAVSDNPLVFTNEGDILSGGNFHAEPVAIAADNLAIAIAEVAALAERRIALLIDPNFSQLPPFLVSNAGLNSGFMLAQVTAAALASENKSLAHPASVDSIPTSANQEDHVSMATFAARRLILMCENAATIIGIELLAACQGIDFLRPLRSSVILEKVHNLVREHVPFYTEDRYFSPDLIKIKRLVQSREIASFTDIDLLKVNYGS